METLQRTANRGSVSTGFSIDNSLKMESDNSEQLYATPWSSAGTRTKHTWSIWVKRTELGTRQMLFEGGTNNTVTTQLSLSFQTTDALEVRAGEFVAGSAAGTVYRLTSRLFRDTSAWYHIVAAFDTTQGTANNRIKIWVNGVQETSFATTANPSQNSDLGLFAANAQVSVGVSANNGFYYNGYLTHAALVYNTQLNADSFGEFDSDSGIWTPIDLSGLTFGAFSFWLKFENSSALGTDSSGEGHDFTLNNITAADQATDSPSNSFCTINLPFEPYVGGAPTITEGATVMTGGSSGQQDSYGTFALFKGKWYFEFSVLNVGGLAIGNMFGGVVKVNRLLQSSINNAANGFHSHDGGWGGNVGAVGVHDGSVSGFSTVSGAAVDKVVGVAVDMDNGKIWWASGGVYASSSGTVSNPATATLPQFSNLLTQYPAEPVVPAYNHYVHQSTTQGAFNFGGFQDHAFRDVGTNSDANGHGSFAYTPPSGYFAICTKNLAEYG